MLGGVIYEEYGLKKNSPTVGCYIYSDDYLKFVKNLRYYLTQDLKIISCDKARHKQWIIEDGNRDAPIGVLDDIEIIFVHYKEPEVAYEKWSKRVQRVNWDNLVFKFSFQNHATLDDLKEFEEAKLPGKKVMYVNRNDVSYKCGIYYPGFENSDQIYNDTFCGKRYFDVVAFINNGVLKSK